ncbi:MAG: acyl-CoA dehydrogenase family protein [SAR324 cluster bacterium]|nr:acyl-CoA dehydrogenase family protein [SAR324 cluster bacterium]
MQFTQDHKMLRQTVSDFIAKEINPYVDEWEKAGIFPAHELFKKMGGLGLLGINKPQEYGGMGLDYSYELVFAEELGKIKCGGVPMAIGVQTDMATPALTRFGSDELKKEFLAPAIAGDYVACIGVSEPHAGSDVANIKTTAVKQGDEYVINGSKMWITNGPESSVYVIYAKTQPGAGPKGITAFIVERNFKGFSRGVKLDKLGMRGSNTCELIFEDCEVPAENILGRENEGVKVLMSGLDYERVILSGGPVGIMQACLDVVVPYVHERKQFGQSIGEFQLIQGKLADMYVTLNASRSYLYAVAKSCDRGETTRKDAAGVILYTAENATQMALNAIQCLGGNGYINEFPTGRLLRDAKLYEIGAGTSEIRRMLIGRELFKESV